MPPEDIDAYINLLTQQADSPTSRKIKRRLDGFEAHYPDECARLRDKFESLNAWR